MNGDRIEGVAQNWAGKVQEAAGKVLDVPEMDAAGVGRQTAGRAQEAYGEVQDSFADALQGAGRMVQQQPWTALLAVWTAGYLWGRYSSWR